MSNDKEKQWQKQPKNKNLKSNIICKYKTMIVNYHIKKNATKITDKLCTLCFERVCI